MTRSGEAAAVGGCGGCFASPQFIGGIAVEFDTFANGWDSSSNHVELSLLGDEVPVTLAAANLDQNLQNSGVFDAEVVFDNGRVEVYLSNLEKGMQKTLLLDHTIPDFVPFEGYLGFVGTTGALTDRHVIHHVRLHGPAAVGEFADQGETTSEIDRAALRVLYIQAGGDADKRKLEEIYLDRGPVYNWIEYGGLIGESEDIEALWIEKLEETEEAVERGEMLPVFLLDIRERWKESSGWTHKDNWLTDAPLGDWHGVTVDPVTGRVTELDLSGNNLRGWIPSSLSNLTNLERLDLSDNNLGLKGFGIPPSLGALPKLAEVNLSSNGLPGEIPPQLGNLLPGLNSLYLYGNNLTGCIPLSLLELLEDDVHTAIEAIDRANRNDTLRDFVLPVGWERAVEGWILPTYGLWLPPCPPSPPAPSTPLDKQTAETDKAALEAIRDYYNDEAAQRRGEFKGWDDSNLNDSNRREGCGVGAWHGVGTKQIDGHCRVTDLRLDKRELVGGILPEVGDLGELTLLNLSRNSLNTEIPPELGNLRDLRSLALNENYLWNKPNNPPIPPELGNLGELRMLNLYGNLRLTGELTPELGNLTNLEHLRIQDTDMTGCMPPTLVNNFSDPLATDIAAPILAFGATAAFTAGTGISLSFLAKRFIGPIVSKIIGAVLDPFIKPGAQHLIPFVGSELGQVKLYCD